MFVVGSIAKKHGHLGASDILTRVPQGKASRSSEVWASICSERIVFEPKRVLAEKS